MRCTYIRYLLIAMIFLLCGMNGTQASASDPAERQVVFVPGRDSHGWGAHSYAADCKLLAGVLNENVPRVKAVVIDGGWPKDLQVFEGADAIVVACDGNSLIGRESNWKVLDAVAGEGVGIVFLHYALDPGDRYGKYLLDWIGGYYKQHWSVNPFWTARFKTLPEHPITRGVEPFELHDEWYYHMWFHEGMENVTPILTAVPPDSTRKRPDGPHSGNPTVRSRLGMPEHVAWAYERPGGGRGFGCTGGHTHWVYAQDDFRKLMLNAICWVAKVDVPPDGVPSPTPSVEQMEAHIEGDRPADWPPGRIRQVIERMNAD